MHYFIEKEKEIVPKNNPKPASKKKKKKKKKKILVIHLYFKIKKNQIIGIIILILHHLDLSPP